MKIEIVTVDNLQEECAGTTCFEASNYIIDAISDCKTIRGIVTIDGVSINFSFSPYFMDGDIFTDNRAHRLSVKYLVPIYVYNNIDIFKKVYPKTT